MIPKVIRSPLSRLWARASAVHEIAGIDVSKWQGDIDWRQVAEAGYKFAIVKLTEGVGYVDPRAAEYIEGAEAAGLRVAAYHFGSWHNADPRSPSTDAWAEAKHHSSTKDLLGLSGKSWLDVEWDSRGRGKDMKPQHLVEWAGEFCAGLDGWAEKGTPPTGIYTGRNFWRYKLGKSAALADRSLWLASYGKEPREFAYRNLARKVFDGAEMELGNWRTTIWQSSGKGKVSGIAGACDLNLFRGTWAEFEGMF